MHKQRPQTVYRNMPFLIGTIFENCDKWYRTWRVEHPEFTRIVFHGLRHSSATYQLMISGGDVKTVQKPCKWRTKRKSHEESYDSSCDFGALEGTRIPGPLIKSAGRAHISIYGSNVILPFYDEVSQFLAVWFVHPVSDFATKIHPRILCDRAKSVQKPCSNSKTNEN